MSFGVDYAWHGDLGPFIKALKAAKVTFVCRYLSHSSGKNLSRAEAEALTAAGISIVVVWETTADRALAGHAAGVQDARDALAQAKACGMPPDRPIFYAVDFDTVRSQLSTVLDYLSGTASVLGHDLVGPYGEHDLCKAAFDSGFKWAWQTYAWSAGKWEPRAQLQQYSNDHTIGGVGLDFDRSMHSDFGQWRIGWTPTPPKPTPAPPTPHPSPTPTTEDDMPTGQLLNGANAATPISFKRGAYKEIGFGAGDDPKVPNRSSLLVQVHDIKGWHDNALTVAAEDGQPIVKFPDPATTNIVRVVRTDGGDVPVAWEVS